MILPQQSLNPKIKPRWWGSLGVVESAVRYNCRIHGFPVPVLALPFWEGAGNKAYDVSGKMNHGTLINGPKRVANALSFDGLNDYVTISDSNSLDVTNNITLSAWIKINTLKSGPQKWQNIITKRDTVAPLTATNYEFRIPDTAWTPGNNELGFNVYNGEWCIYETSNADFVINTWYHVVVTYDNTNPAKFYKNGQLLTASLVWGTGGLDMIANTVPVIVGAFPVPTYDTYFNGIIDLPCIYNQILTPAQIKFEYDNPYFMFQPIPVPYVYAAGEEAPPPSTPLPPPQIITW